jgi:pectate lyase
MVSACSSGAAGRGEPGGGSAEIDVQPASATVQIGRNATFSASIAVDWSVREGTTGGSVTGGGLYTAPGSAGTFHVVATSRDDPSISGSATVTVTATAPGSGGEVLAFPGAEGFGARATGGRGGQVIKVTNLNASGPGSLQAALDVNAPRIIVFAVSGVIRGDIEVPHGNVTIAGQTAPGGGITIAGLLTGAYSYGVQNIIIRHLRVRPPRCQTGCDAAQYDAIQFSRNSLLILDHVSVAYGADETIDIYEADDVTIQWSTIEASQDADHPDGHIHNYGIIQGPDGHRISFHHNLCAHHSRRCPAIANGPADVRNNVAYNVRHAFLHSNPAQGDFNFVGNYFKQGPNDSLFPYYFDDEDESAGTRTSYYLRDSYVDDPGQLVGAVDNPWTEPYFTDLYLDASYRSTEEFDFASAVPDYVRVTTQASSEAYDLVLANAGAFPRDSFTTATVDQVRSRGGAWDPQLPSDLMAGLTPGTPPADADGDGMADAWESAHGLSPANGADHDTLMPSGYTAIEEYINELAAR